MLRKIRMLAHLGYLGLKDILKDDKILMEPPAIEKKEDDDSSAAGSPKAKSQSQDPSKVEKSEKAMNLIVLNVGDHVLRKISHCTTVAAMWMLLEKLYMSTSLPSRIFLQLKFYNFKMVDSESIDANVDEFLKLVSDLCSVGVSVTDEVQAILLLCSLPSKYNQLKETLKYAKDTITLEAVIAAARDKEREFKDTGSSGKEAGEGLVMKERFQSRGRAEWRGASKRNGRSRSNSKSRMVCWYCKKGGHMRKDCFSRKKKFDREDQGEAAVIVDKLHYSNALAVSDLNPRDNWVIDSGCTYHMTSMRDWFDTFSELDGNQILLGDNHTVEAKGIGSVRVNTHGGSVTVMHNVRYVPHLRRNLISTGTLDKLGFRHSGGDGKVTFHKNGRLCMRGILKQGLYILDGETIVGEVHQGEASSKGPSLWQNRLGHISDKNLKILVSKGILDKKDVGAQGFCENCVMGKTKKVNFSVGKHDTEKVLGYVHADLWGSPSVHPSISKCHYFLSIIDDCSHKVRLYFLKTKDEAYGKFCEWKTLVENQSSQKVKCLRTDNGLEFCNVQFDSFCNKNGIARHRTCTYTPQQNGVAKRMNHTIMEKVRCMLNQSGLEEKFWAEAAATAAYLINRTPSSAIDNNIPEEVWLNKEPGYKHLRTFGSVVYIHTDQGKLKPRALKGVFIGYPPGVKGYKVWLIEQKQCVISRNVQFQEQTMFKDIDKPVIQAVDQPVEQASTKVELVLDKGKGK